MDVDLVDRAAWTRRERRAGVPLGSLALTRGRARRPSRRRSGARCSSRPTRTSTPATPSGGSCRSPRGSLCVGGSSTYVRRPPYFDGLAREDRVRRRRPRRSLPRVAGDSVTTDHISPAGSIKPDGPAGQYLDRARRRARRLQLVRLASRQPRGDGAGNVRQRPPSQPARARLRGHVDGASSVRRRDDDLRGRRAVSRGRGADDRARRQGVRLGVVARLGGEGASAVGRARGDRRELRADPPLESA